MGSVPVKQKEGVNIYEIYRHGEIVYSFKLFKSASISFCAFKSSSFSF